MFNKLKQLLSGQSDPPPPTDDLPPDELYSTIDFTVPRTAYFGRQLEDETPCPNCQTTLEITHAPFMVALIDKNGRTVDGFVMGDQAIGRFCPNCPTVMVDMHTVEERIEAIEDTFDDLPADYGIAVIGLLDLETMAELEEQGEEIDEYPIIPFVAPPGSAKKRPSGRQKTKKRKTQRKKRR